MTSQPSKHDICFNCGHYYFLHDIASNECAAACDSPAIPIASKCFQFVGVPEMEHEL